MARGVAIYGGEFRKVREQLFLTQAELANMLDTSVSGIQRIERQFVVRVVPSTLRKLADVAGRSVQGVTERVAVPPDELARIEAEREVEDAAAAVEASDAPATAGDNVDPETTRWTPSEIPTFDMAVAAGPWQDVTDVGEVWQPGQIDRGFFRVRIRGDSMQPAYLDGETVEFRCLRDGRDALEVGEDYYVQLADGTATFKRLESVTEEGLVLRAVNRRKYSEPMSVARDEIVRMAVALHIITPKRKGAK